MNYLRTVVELFDLQVRTYEPILDIKRNDGTFHLTTEHRGDTHRYRARHLILATGGTDHPRRLNIPGEDLPHVDHYFRDPHTYFKTNLLVVGGKNSAVEAALRCHHAGANVSMSYRRNQLPEKSIKYWLMPEIQSLFKSERIKSYFDTQPVEITPSHVLLERPATGERFKVPADFVLLLIGYEQDNTLFKCAGVEIRGDCGVPVFDAHTMETNVPNLYVAGTAVAGTQEKYQVFIENCHVHAERIVAAITGSLHVRRRFRRRSWRCRKAEVDELFRRTRNSLGTTIAGMKHRFSFFSSIAQPPEYSVPIVEVQVERPLRRILAFTGRSIDDVVNDPIAKRQVLGYYKLHLQVARSCEITELERQWNR